MAQQTMTEKDAFLATADREAQTNLKVLRAYPPDQSGLRPHPTSQTAAELAWLLAKGQMIMQKLVTVNELAPGTTPEQPKSWQEIVSGFESAHRDMKTTVSKMSEAQFNEPITMPVGFQKTSQVRRGDAMWMFLYDGIHHRGQLSVYLRMTGSKVPSIYGPSKDEPWF